MTESGELQPPTRPASPRFVQERRAWQAEPAVKSKPLFLKLQVRSPARVDGKVMLVASHRLCAHEIEHEKWMACGKESFMHNWSEKFKSHHSKGRGHNLLLHLIVILPSPSVLCSPQWQANEHKRWAAEAKGRHFHRGASRQKMASWRLKRTILWWSGCQVLLQIRKKEATRN